jgi:predicted enzyme related to lactoylglutathione lyase
MSIQSVYMVVQDMDRADRFYQAVLGVSPKFRDGSAWCQFGIGPMNFALSSIQEAAQDTQRSVVVFETSDLDRTRRGVEAAGGRCIAARDMGSHGSVLSFADLDGNLFQAFARMTRAPFISTPTDPL